MKTELPLTREQLHGWIADRLLRLVDQYGSWQGPDCRDVADEILAKVVEQAACDPIAFTAEQSQDDHGSLEKALQTWENDLHPEERQSNERYDGYYLGVVQTLEWVRRHMGAIFQAQPQEPKHIEIASHGAFIVHHSSQPGFITVNTPEAVIRIPFKLADAIIEHRDKLAGLTSQAKGDLDPRIVALISAAEQYSHLECSRDGGTNDANCMRCLGDAAHEASLAHYLDIKYGSP